jgi:glycerophosphoryl diester phosphodiesterase
MGLSARERLTCLERSLILLIEVETLIGAHRGASVDAPENTLAAFELAVTQGAELIELDVHATRDGVLVVHHDFDLRRTAGSAGLIRELTVSEVQTFDVGSWRGTKFAGERIPTLDKVLQTYGNRVLLNVEIKFDRVPYEGIESAVARAIRACGLSRRVVVSSFDLETLLRLRRIDGDIRVSLLHDAAKSSVPDSGALDAASVMFARMAVAREAGMVGIHLDAASISADVCARAKELGLGVLAWTVDSEPEMRRLAALGIDAIVSNRPALLRAVLLEMRRAGN